MRSPRPEAERGAAVTEMALLMIVLIPLIAYSIYLMDAAYMRINFQETLVAGIWDFSTRSIEPDGSQNQSDVAQEEMYPVQKNVELTYDDHTSVYDDGADPTNSSRYGNHSALHGGSDEHHVGYGAQGAYKTGNQDTEFVCTVSSNRPDLSWAGPNMFFTNYGKSGYAGGGYAACEATGWIYNYVIPETFMKEFTSVKVSDEHYREHGTDPHDIQGEGGTQANIAAHDRAAISFDTWALRTGAQDGKLTNADIAKPDWSGIPQMDSNNPFAKRVDYTYSSDFSPTYALVEAAAAQFELTAANNKLMVVTPPTPGVPSTASQSLPPNIGATYLTARYQPGSPGIRQKAPGMMSGLMGGNGFQTTPYDDANNNYQSAYQARGNYYLGCKQPENASCF